MTRRIISIVIENNKKIKKEFNLLINYLTHELPETEIRITTQEELMAICSNTRPFWLKQYPQTTEISFLLVLPEDALINVHTEILPRVVSLLDKKPDLLNLLVIGILPQNIFSEDSKITTALFSFLQQCSSEREERSKFLSHKTLAERHLNIVSTDLTPFLLKFRTLIQDSSVNRTLSNIYTEALIPASSFFDKTKYQLERAKHSIQQNTLNMGAFSVIAGILWNIDYNSSWATAQIGMLMILLVVIAKFSDFCQLALNEAAYYKHSLESHVQIGWQEIISLVRQFNLFTSTTTEVVATVKEEIPQTGVVIRESIKEIVKIGRDLADELRNSMKVVNEEIRKLGGEASLLSRQMKSLIKMVETEIAQYGAVNRDTLIRLRDYLPTFIKDVRADLNTHITRSIGLADARAAGLERAFTRLTEAVGRAAEAGKLTPTVNAPVKATVCLIL